MLTRKSTPLAGGLITSRGPAALALDAGMSLATGDTIAR
jgi:hypothetical protein